MNFKQDIFEIIQIVKGNIVTVEADAIVNTTDSSFSALGGIDYAIQKSAGENLAKTLRAGRKIKEGQAIITPAFELKTAKWIIHTVGPKWQNGFRAEESLLAECYRRSLGLALENRCESIAFPCVSVGYNHFPEERAAEIAVNTVYNMLSATEDFHLSRILFICSSDEQEKIYKKYLKKIIIDKFLYLYSPESYNCEFASTQEYFIYMGLLGDLEWGHRKHYDDYCHNFMQISGDGVSDKYTPYDKYALNMDMWDYNTCLSYIIFLQREAYWSGGLEDPHYDQWNNGTVRKVLLRMRTLLN